jgi:lipopolysaccharide exporter
MFWKNVMSIMSGTAAGQVVALVSMPILTRLYVPSQFGTMGLLVAISSIISILATMRYEVAIVLPEKDEVAAVIASVAFLMVTGISLLLMIGISIYWAEISRILSVSERGHWIFLVPLLTLLMAVFNIFRMWNCRNHQFRHIAFASPALHVGYTFISLIIALSPFNINGLVVGRVAGQLMGAIVLLKGNFLNFCSAIWASFPKKNWLHIVGNYRQFPLFNTPYSLLGAISKEAIVLIFAMTNSLSAAGSYLMARTIIYVPIGLISTSIGPVFYREAVSVLHEEDFQQRTLDMFFVIAILAGPLYVFAAFWGVEIFQIILGSQWREAGEFFSLLIPVGLMLLLTSWPDRVFEVTKHQHLSLTLRLIFDTLSVGIVIVMKMKGVELSLCVAAFSIITTLFHLAYLATLFRLMHLPLAAYFKLVFLLVGLVSTSWLILWAGQDLFGRGIGGFVVGMMAMLLLYSAIALIFKKDIRLVWARAKVKETAYPIRRNSYD